LFMFNVFFSVNRLCAATVKKKVKIKINE